MENYENYAERRKIFMETFGGNPILTDIIPSVAAALVYDEFNINTYDTSYFPIVFVTGWTEILKYVGSQVSEEFAVEVCGISVEYVTDFSETDKPTNIVPRLIHKRDPIFMKQDHNAVVGSTYNGDLIKRYESWRSVNLAETIGKIERDVYKIVLEDYGIDLINEVTVFPFMAAIYAAGLQKARETKQTINMYNIFEIDVVNDEKVLLTPLSIVKQYLKDDSKK